MKLNVKTLFLIIAVVVVILIPVRGVYAAGFSSFTAYSLSPDTDSKVKLDWSNVVGAKTYELYRDEVLIETIDTDTMPDPLTYTDTNSGAGLQPETTYTYRIEAFSADSTMLDSRQAIVTTTDIIIPYNVKAVYNINSKSTLLTWKSSLHAISSIISRTENGETTETPTPSTTNAFITELGESPILYSIKSNWSGGASTKSYPISITPFEAPTVSAAISRGSVSVTWSSYMYTSYFILERSKWNEDLNKWDDWTVAKSSLSGQSSLDTPPGIGLYRYRLAAKGNSVYSGHSNITTAVKHLTAPKDLVLTVSGNNSIALEWVNSEEWQNSTESELGIQVQRRGNDGIFTTVSGSDLLEKTATSFTDTVDVTEGMVYTYRVRYADADLNYSSEAIGSITAALPSSPTSLHADVLSAGVIRLSWQDNSNNESGFRVERKTDSGNFEEIGVTDKNAQTYTDSNVTAGHSYTYRVRSYNSMGVSGYSNETAITGWDTVSPASLTATPVSSNRIDLVWSYTGTTAYNTVIERKSGSGGEWRVINTTASGVLKYSDTGLSSNTRYFYRIRKYIGEGASGVSYPANDIGVGATTLLTGLNLSGTAFSGNTIYLTWSGNTGNSDVVIERKMSNGSFSALTTVNSTTTGWYDNTGLIPGALYTYRVKAKSPTNESVYSNELTINNFFLEAPSVLTATADEESSIELTWIDNSTSETGFEIWRSTYVSGNYILYDAVGENTTSYTDSSVQKGVQYYYMVRSYVATEGMYSSYSNSASVGIGLIKPPENLRYTYVSESSVTLIWKDVSDNETGFKVERKIGENGDWSTVSWLSANTTSYTMTGLNSSFKYYMRIRAYRYSDNADSVSEEILVSTLIPAAPTGVSAKALSPSQIKIEWDDNSDSEVGFKILRRAPLSYYFMPIAEVGQNTTSYIDRNLSPGTSYVYKVASYNPSGTSESGQVSAVTTSRTTFDDLGNVPWAKDAIESLAGAGVIKGVSASRYNPQGLVSKAEFTALIVRAFEFETSPVGRLDDVKSNKWYYREVMIAENFGLIEGDSSNKFYPEQPIKREEIATILVNAIRESGNIIPVHDNSVLEKYSDRNMVSPSAIASVAALVGEGILEGTSTVSISPKNTLTRAQAAVFIYRALNKYYGIS